MCSSQMRRCRVRIITTQNDQLVEMRASSMNLLRKNLAAEIASVGLALSLIAAPWPLFAEIAPEFNGQFSVRISRIDGVTLEPDRIVLKGLGSPIMLRSRIYESRASTGHGNSSAPNLQIFIFKSTWEASGRPWKACIAKVEKLRTFRGTATAIDAGYGTYSDAFYFLTCSDLVDLKGE